MTASPYASALKKLARTDPILGAALKLVGPPPPRNRPPGFASLARIIVGQQVSTASATSMWMRLCAAIDPIAPENVLARSADELRALGLSRQKAAYTLGLARALADGTLVLDDVHALEDEAAIAELTKLNGFGRWSAEIYLLFSLERPDIWPSGDLGLQIGLQRLRRLRQRPDPKRMIRLAEPWRPYRGAVAHFLWHYYHKAPFAERETR